MSKLTQGTQLYVIDPRGSEPAVLVINCITGFNPGGAPKSQIDDTCLDETEAMRYRAGLKAPGQATINLNADPTNASHVALYELYEDPLVEDLHWVVGWSDGKDIPPTIDSNGEFELPTTRSWFRFDGYIADFPFDHQGNTVVATAATVQRNGAGRWVRKAVV